MAGEPRLPTRPHGTRARATFSFFEKVPRKGCDVGVAMGVRKFIKRESPGEYEGYSEQFLVEPRTREEFD